MKLSLDPQVFQKVTDLIKLLREEFSDPRNAEAVTRLRKRAFGNAREAVVFGFCGSDDSDDFSVSMDEVLSDSLLAEMKKYGVESAMHLQKGLLKQWYSVKPGRSDKFDDCTFEWTHSILPFFLEFRIQFHDELLQRRTLVSFEPFKYCMELPDCFDTVYQATLRLREEEEEEIRKKLAGTLPFSMRDEFQLPADQNLLNREKAERFKKATVNTRKLWPELLKLKYDPLRNHSKWNPTMSQLAIATSSMKADISIFKNLERFAKQRYENFLAEEASHEPKHSQSKAEEDAIMEKLGSDNIPAASPRIARKKKKKRKTKTTNVDAESESPSSAIDTALKPNTCSLDIAGSDVPGAINMSEYAKSTDPPKEHLENCKTLLDFRGTKCSTLKQPSKMKRRASTSLLCQGSKIVEEGRRVSFSNLLDMNPTLLARETPSLTSSEECSTFNDDDPPEGNSFIEEAVPLLYLDSLNPYGEALHAKLKVSSKITDSVTSQLDQASSGKNGRCANKEGPPPPKAGPKISDDQPSATTATGGCDPPAYQTWAHSYECTYYDDLLAYPELFDASKPLFLKAPGWHPESYNWNTLPIVVLQARIPGKKPLFIYDEVNNRLVVTPHAEPLADLRQMEKYIDWLPTNKLLEYQAAEIAGHSIWRFDRQVQQCTLPGCAAFCMDHEQKTQICLACGPCTNVRYCSRAHQDQDLKEHWEECGSQDLVVPTHVDLDTQPRRFKNLYPAIEDLGWRSYEKYRQRQYSIWSDGQYTLFPLNREPYTVSWPTISLQNTYGPRVERLLNISLYDQTRDDLVEYLFYLVRMALRVQNKYSRNVAAGLAYQFKAEFDWDATAAREEDPCECRWHGKVADEKHCTPECVTVHTRWQLMGHRAGIRQMLEAIEAKRWILRVWQRQHPTVPDWRRRLAGEGFPGARIRDLDTERPRMGRGWMGFGALDTIGGWEPIL